MADRPAPGYGTPNWDMIHRWFGLAPEDDTEFWALNLMKYRPVAVYADGRETALSGQEADDAYAPRGPLAAVGAMIAFHGEVSDQRRGEPTWDRIGIVRYPSRAAFFAMQQRDDFKAQHEHKEAGMERTIVMACHPVRHDEAATGGTLVLTVERVDAVPPPAVAGVSPVVELSVEGVIVGDERTWTRARFDRAADDDAVAALVAAADEAEEAFAMVLADPEIDALVESVTTAPNASSAAIRGVAS